MMQTVHLLVYGGIDTVVQMTNADSDDAAEKVEVLLAIRVPNVLILGSLDDEGAVKEVEHRREQVLLPGEDQFVAVVAIRRHTCIVPYRANLGALRSDRREKVEPGGGQPGRLARARGTVWVLGRRRLSAPRPSPASRARR